MAQKPAANQRARRNVVRESSRPKAFIPLLIVIAVVGASILGYVLSRKPPAPEFKPIVIDPASAAPEHGYLLGKADAPVKILEYADFECPACGHFATVTEPDVRKRLIETGIASLTFLDFPLSQHRNSQAASNAAACADEQGKFWQMHDELFNGQPDWNTQATDNPKSLFQKYATEIGLDMTRWESCYDARKYQKRIESNYASGERLKVAQTPTFVVGGQLVVGAPSFDALKATVDSAARKAAADSTARK
ncbi:MAG TPA: thioredoxin domain-containing protein [Gemmatimonadaceae bacterium]|jgi:protein-disulfide isomerase